MYEFLFWHVKSLELITLSLQKEKKLNKLKISNSS